MSSEKPTKKNRYPGIRSFEADDERLFYGRSSEIEELFNLIKIKPLIVLFGKSGLGKTSLLKAGVGPLLKKQHYYPLIIRLQDTSISPDLTVLNELEPFVDQALLKKFGNKSENKIWEYLKASAFQSMDGHAATPVLIFDQFEELFNHSQKVQETWTSHIADLIDSRLPSDIEETLNNVPRAERSLELMSWFRPPNVKIVFAIRSDRMSELHKMRYEIPAILQNRYELKPLQARQAQAAIEKPAALTGTEFSTKPFSYAPETIGKIEKELSNERDEIESFQLQIVCQHTEQKVKQEQEKGVQQVEVTPDYLVGEEGIKNILKNYYNTQLESLGTEEEQMAARKFLEEGLIMNERRISVAEAAVSETYHIGETLLSKLLSSRLIRPEDTRLGRTYEISHDTLVKPILEAYEKRRVKDEQNAAILAQKDQAKKTRRKVIIGVTAIIGILLIGLTSFAFYQSNQLKNVLEDLTERNAQLEALISAYADRNGITKEDAAQEIEKERIKILIRDLYSQREFERENSTNELLRSYHKNNQLVPELLNSIQGKINRQHVNSIYRIIYILENLDSDILSANKIQVQAFVKSVEGSKLFGPAIKTKLKRIESKLN